MQLLLNGWSLSISHLGPGFIRVNDAPEHPPAEGEIILTIDGDEDRWRVRLPEGLRPGPHRIRIAKPEAARPA